MALAHRRLARPERLSRSTTCGAGCGRSGLRPTRQRVGLGWLLFAKGDRHVTAEAAATRRPPQARVPVSLATIYNTLHQFTQAGLLREVAVDGAKTYFDTNVGNHHHFFVEGENVLQDIDGSMSRSRPCPSRRTGMEIARVDVIVRLRRKPRLSARVAGGLSRPSRSG